ncbi:hypothetical protein [Burkholderia sp. Ac-20365]|uniref:hypothetical protein n=1 Tax=Burkholderia sp. Ac-20365 TaxID=2703897 RepID=UPI00197CB2C5|nr:hypothetical protein [Burkholderia sp. Ac-20365]MBN3761084.1 hypothetical protein [Burkholderia sp. Ac-20365]
MSNVESNDPEGVNIAVMSPAGTSGKSTASACLLQPNLGDEPILSFESSNDDAHDLYGAEIETFVPETFSSYMEVLAQRDRAGKNSVTDVGASCYEPFMFELRDSHVLHSYDYVVLVADPGRAQTDVLLCLEKLLDQGLEPSKVRLLLNKTKPVKRGFSMAMQFSTLFKGCMDLGVETNENCFIPHHALFSYIHLHKIDWRDLLADVADHRGAVAATRGQPMGQRLSREKAATAQRLRDGALPHLARAFRELNIGPPTAPAFGYVSALTSEHLDVA